MRCKVILALLLSMLLFFTGCWDVGEINRRGIADAIFLDAGTTKPVKIGVSLPVPGTQTPPVKGTEQQFEKRNMVVSGEGDAVLDAWTRVQSNLPRDVFFGQIRAIVLSEQAAGGDINDLLDFIGRLPLLPPNIHVLVAKGDPEQLFDLQNETNYIPGNYVDYYFQSVSKRTLSLPVDLWRVNSILDKKWGDPYLPIMEISQDNIKIAGTAVFSGSRMVGELDMGEAQTLALVRGADEGFLTVPLSDGKLVAFRSVKSRTQIKPTVAGDGTLTFDVTTKISGDLVESWPHQEIFIKEKDKMQKEAEALAQRQIKALLAKLQGWNSDPAGFGGKYRITYPHRWEGTDWHQVYPEAKFNVRTEFTVKSTGLFR